jgi:hypothetical protein
LTSEILSATQVLLTWDPEGGATAHRVYKNGVVEALAESSWVDNAFDPNVVTRYEVRAITIGFDDGPVGEFEPITTVGPAAVLILGDDAGETDVPPAPGSLTVPQGFSATQTALDEVTLTWELLTPATHIDVSIDSVLTRIPADVSYTDTGVPIGATRTYRVRAVNEADDPEVTSDFTSALEVTTVGLGIPDPNVNVQSSTRILVDWAAVPAATSYDIEVDGTVIELGDFPAAQDSGLAPVTTRTYRVRARSNGIIGDWSGEVTGTTFRTQELTIEGVLKRLSDFPSDRHITARALEAEFNNIYALLEPSGVITENTVEPDDPTLDPLPDPGGTGTPVPEGDVPQITGLTASWDATGLMASWDAIPDFSTVDQKYVQVEVQRPPQAWKRVLFELGTPTTADIDGYADTADLNIRARVVTGARDEANRIVVVKAGLWSDPFALDAVEVPPAPTMPIPQDVEATWSDPANDEITVTWTDVSIPGSGQYQIEIRDDANTVVANVTSADGSTSAIIASGVSIENNYSIRMRTIEGSLTVLGNVSAWSDTYVLPSTSLPDQLEPIPFVQDAAVTWTDSDAGTATVTWTDIDFPGDVSSPQYHVRVQVQDFSPTQGIFYTTVQNQAVADDTATLLLTGLDDFENYHIRVRGVDGSITDPDRVGQWSFFANLNAVAPPPEDVEVVAVETGTTLNGLNHTVPVPASAETGDVVMVVGLLAFDDMLSIQDEAALLTVPTDFNVVVPSPSSIKGFAGPPQGWPLFAASRVMPASVPTELTFTTPESCFLGYHVFVVRFADPVVTTLEGFSEQETTRIWSNTQQAQDQLSFFGDLPTLTNTPDRPVLQVGAFELEPGATLIRTDANITPLSLRQTSVAGRGQLVTWWSKVRTSNTTANARFIYSPGEFANPDETDFNRFHRGKLAVATG